MNKLSTSTVILLLYPPLGDLYIVRGMYDYHPLEMAIKDHHDLARLSPKLRGEG